MTNPAHLQKLHLLATERYDKVLDKLVAAEKNGEQATDYDDPTTTLAFLRYDEQHQSAFISELQALLAEAGVDPLPR